MNTKQSIFRKVALERLSTPDQLDRLVQVVRPVDWLVLLALAGLILVALAWGWVGSIPTKVSGKCMLVNPSGLVDVAAGATGRLAALTVQIGDRIHRGQQIGMLALPELSDQIEKARATLVELEAQRLRVRSFANRGKQLNIDLVGQQRQMLLAQQSSSEERLRLLRERLEAHARLLAQGMITNQAWLSARQELNAAQGELDDLVARIAQLELRRLESDKRSDGEIASMDQQIEERKRQLDTLLRGRQNSAVIDSPFSGRVVEIKAGLGMLLSQGTAVLSLEQDSPAGPALEVAIFVPAGDGKRVSPQMVAQVTPATVKREENGYLLAQVHYVADYPASMQRMQMLLQNEWVVKDLVDRGAPIEIRAALRPAANASGYVWSSAAGAATPIRSGTPCQADIVVATQRPASLVLPLLKRSIGVD